MPKLHQYSADFVDIIYGAVTVVGYAEKFIEVEFEEDDFKKMVGSLGDVTRSRLLNRSGKITVTLLDSSESNDALMAYAVTDRRTGLGAKEFIMLDRSSNTEVRATQTWVMKIPKVERGKEAGTTVWVFEAAFLEMNIGGSVL